MIPKLFHYISKMLICLVFPLIFELHAQEQATAPTPILIRPFGDSITYGVGFSDWGLCPIFPINQFVCMPPSPVGGGYRGFMTLYATQNVGITFTTEGYQSGGSYFLQWILNTQTHDGYPGYRTDQLIQMSKYASFANFTLVHAGTNDILQNKNKDKGIDTAVTNLFTLVGNLLDKNKNMTVLLAQIIQFDSSGKFAHLNSQVLAYNQKIRMQYDSLDPSQKLRVKLVDMSNLLKPQIEYSVDGIHPNYLGYSKMACKWIAKIKNVDTFPSGSVCYNYETNLLKKEAYPSKSDLKKLRTPKKDQVEKMMRGKL